MGGPALSVPDSASACAAWISSNELVIHNRAGGRLFRIDEDSATPVEEVAQFSSELTDVIGVVPTAQAKNVALFDAAGRVQIWGAEGLLRP